MDKHREKRLKTDKEIEEALWDENLDEDVVDFDSSDEEEWTPPEVQEAGSDSESESENEGKAIEEEIEEELDLAIKRSETGKDPVQQKSKTTVQKKGKKKPLVSVGSDVKSGRKKNAELDEQDCIVTFDSDTIRGKEGKEKAESVFVWKTSPISLITRKTGRKNVIHISPGPVGDAKNAIEPIDCFSLFVTDEMIELVMKYTNEEIERNRVKYKKKNEMTFSKIECIDELKALFGLFIYAAAKKDNHLPTTLLFNESHCGNWYRSTMSIKRFEFLIRCIRFDSRETRIERQEAGDKMAPVSEIWQLFLQNCRTHYKPGSYTTIDEQLVPFRGNCPFRMFIPNKPNKYGIKNIMMCDSSTKYMIDCITYAGRGTAPPGSSSEFYVDRLVQTIKNTNRNVTFDNWFTTIPLMSKLAHEGLTAVGTVRKNKRQLPADFCDPHFKKRKVGSSLFMYHNDMTAVSYKAKSNKVVCLLSTMHDDPDLHPISKKPSIIHTYNATKGGVDSLDQLCSNMSCNRKTKRWPLCFFYNILNLTSVNAFVIYTHNIYREAYISSLPSTSKNNSTGTSALTRLNFMIKLNEQLSKTWKQQRLQKCTRISRNLRNAIQENISSAGCANNQTDVDSAPREGQNLIKRRKYCDFCASSKHKYTTVFCKKCDKAICGSHQEKFCKDCSK